MVIYIRCAENGRKKRNPEEEKGKEGAEHNEQVIEKRTTIEEETSEN